MKATVPVHAGNLKFLEQHRVEDESISLPSGVQVSIPKYFLTFKPWTGKALEFDYGRKPVIDFDGQACFAELAILRLFLNQGWNGAWIETYGGMHFLNSMPSGWSLKSEHITIPAEREQLIRDIWEAGNTRACFDVVVWDENTTLFCEAKRHKKDKLTDAQIRFMQGALACGIPASTLLIIEWDFASSNGLTFEYPEDRKFFVNLLAGGNEEKFDKEFSDYFDFSHPAIKRWVFNKTSKKVLAELIEKYDGKCQLRIHPECSTTGVWHPDHVIPLASAELHRKLRSLKNNPDGSKPESVSYGSNHPKNLTLACEKCNLRKKHRIIWPVPKDEESANVKPTCPKRIYKKK